MRFPFNNRTTRAVVAGGIAASVLAAVAVPAFATTPVSKSHPDASVNRVGSCTGGTARWNANMSARSHRQLEASFSVDGARVGSRWNVVMTHNGKVVYSGTRTAGAATGGWEVSRHVPQFSGHNTLATVATNRASGAVCRATIKL